MAYSTSNTNNVKGYSTGNTTKPLTIQDTLNQYMQQYDAAKAANLQRYEQGLNIYDEIIKRYRPGGTFGQAALQELASQKDIYIGKGTQDLISSGLFGTSTRAGLGGKFEKEIGSPYRLKLEDLMMERLSQAQMGKASFIESREDVYPDLNRMAELASQASQQYEPTVNRVVGGTYGASSFPDMFSIPGETGSLSIGGTQKVPTTGQGDALGGQEYSATPTTGQGTVLGGQAYTPPTQSPTTTVDQYEAYKAAVKSVTPTATVISREQWQKIGSPSAKSYLAKIK